MVAKLPPKHIDCCCCCCKRQKAFRSIFICFDLITELLALSSKENASLVTNKIQQVKRQLAKKKSRRKYANKYQKNLAEA